jgi:hypothetical protein
MQGYLDHHPPTPPGKLHGTPSGHGDPVVVGYLREVRHGRHRMLLRTGANAADGSDPVFRAATALQAGSKLRATQQAADPCNIAWPFGLPHSADLVRGCLVLLGRGLPPWFSYLACAAVRAAVADARLADRPAGGQRSIPRSINASNIRRSVAGSGHELGVLNRLCVARDDPATQLGVRMGSGCRLSDRPTHPVERQRRWRRDNPKAFRGFGTSWRLDPVIVAQSRYRPTSADRRQPIWGSADRPGPRNPSPNADSVAVHTKDPEGGPMDLVAWFT